MQNFNSMQSNEKNVTNANAPLIKVEQKEGQQIVSARELYSFLDVKTDFTDWCKRMFDYGFIENQDFTILLKNGENKISKSNPIDYALTLDCSKEIAMLQRSEKGKQARQYFIECEKKLSNLSPAEFLLHHANMMVKLEREQKAQAERINLIEAKQSTINEDYFSLSGYYRIKNKKWDLSNEEAQQLGKKLSALSIVRDTEVIKVSDVKYGKINSYHIDILNEYFGKK